jgi:SAM-dependent methyltransferase
VNKHQTEKPHYGNWVSAKLIYIPGILTLAFLVLAVVFALPLLIISALFFLPFVYFAYAWYRFSPKGGSIQSHIQGLLLDRLEWEGNGKALDIGCGNGSVTIMIAKKFPNAQVTGIDYWGGMWEYSKGMCEKNAEIEGVAGRVTFQKASAAALPFEDELFDAVASNLVFHEIRGDKDKREPIREALRVLQKGGRFAFQDLFLWKILYGEVDDLLEAIRSWGIARIEFVDTSNSDFIPQALKLPFMLGTTGILYGQK